MNNNQLYTNAQEEWNHSVSLRRQFPTFEFYWREHYSRVYNTSRMDKLLRRFFKAFH